MSGLNKWIKSTIDVIEAGVVLATLLVAPSHAQTASALLPDGEDISPMCGSKPIILGYADGYSGNSWRKTALAEVRDELRKCPNVSDIKTADAGGDAQKAFSDINNLVAQGVNVLLVHPDAGDALLPALRDATAAGVTVVAWEVKLSGQEGEDYAAFFDEFAKELKKFPDLKLVENNYVVTMLEGLLKLYHPIKFGPLTVNGEAVAGTGTTGTPLHLYPDATSMQHSEIAGTRDTIDAFRERLPRILRGLLDNANYEISKRSILPQAKIHPTVKERFALETIIDCAGDKVGNYRPEALREHNDFKQFYPDLPPADAPPPGRSEEPAPPT
jgi:hypothetical protein